MAFSLVLGPVADELRAATIPVIDDLDRLGSAPDVIHGHHHIETLIATLRFPRVPVVHFCHGWIPWEEKPLRHPAIACYVAVDEVCADRLIREEGVAPEQVQVLLNFVDLKKFAKREPLPVRPSRALIFSNQAAPDGYSRTIRTACDAGGMSLTIAGTGSGNPTPAPEILLPQFDLVFAKGRAALEAMAVGCAVVLSDRAGCGPLVTPENFDRLRPRNFGIRARWPRHGVNGTRPRARCRPSAGASRPRTPRLPPRSAAWRASSGRARSIERFQLSGCAMPCWACHCRARPPVRRRVCSHGWSADVRRCS